MSGPKIDCSLRDNKSFDLIQFDLNLNIQHMNIFSLKPHWHLSCASYFAVRASTPSRSGSSPASCSSSLPSWPTSASSARISSNTSGKSKASTGLRITNEWGTFVKKWSGWSAIREKRSFPYLLLSGRFMITKSKRSSSERKRKASRQKISDDEQFYRFSCSLWLRQILHTSFFLQACGCLPHPGFPDQLSHIQHSVLVLLSIRAIRSST